MTVFPRRSRAFSLLRRAQRTNSEPDNHSQSSDPHKPIHTFTYEINKTISHKASKRRSGDTTLQPGVCHRHLCISLWKASWPLRKGEQQAAKRVSLELMEATVLPGKLLPPPNLEGSEDPAATGEVLTSVTEVFSSGRG